MKVIAALPCKEFGDLPDDDKQESMRALGCQHQHNYDCSLSRKMLLVGAHGEGVRYDGPGAIAILADHKKTRKFGDHKVLLVHGTIFSREEWRDYCESSNISKVDERNMWISESTMVLYSRFWQLESERQDTR